MNVRNASKESQLAVSDRAAAGFAYFTAIPAVFFLLRDPYRKRHFVRFHAWQAIYFLFACILIGLVIDVLTETIPFLRFLEFDHFPLVSLLLVILWVVVVIKAVNGERYRLPLIGAMAEKRAQLPQD